MLRRCVVFMGFLLVFLMACSGPEAKKLRFYSKAKGLMEKGDLVKASLELKNAIQIDPKYADAYVLLGQLELRKKKFQQAFGSFRKAVELAPGNLDAQVELGKLYLMTGDSGIAVAEEKADLVLKAQPANTEGILLRAGILMIRREFSSAATLLEGMIAGGVTKPDAYQMLAQVHSALNDTQAAEKILLAGAAKIPSSIGIQKSLADFYAASGRVEDAAATIRRMMALEPTNYSYGITLATLYMNVGRAADVRDILSKLQTANPKNEECLIDLSRFYLSQHQPDEAEKILVAGIKAVPDSFRLRFALSELYAGTGKNDQAVALLNECIKLDKDPKKPEVIAARNMLARNFFARGEITEAERSLAEIFKVSASNNDATYLKGRIHLLKKEGPSAISAFRTFINDHPKDAEGHLLLADAHQINQEPKLAQESLQQAERLEPDSLRVARASARFSFLQKENRKGEERMLGYLAKHPDDYEARIELGDLYRLAGDFRKAEAEYGSVKFRAPKLPLPYIRLSEMSAQQGNMARAVSEMETVVRKLVPDNVRAAILLANLYARASQLPKARQLFEELYAKHPNEWYLANDYSCFLSEHGTTPADLERACSLAMAAAAKKPNDPNIFDTLGWAEYRRGNYARAVEHLEKATAKVPGHQIFNYHLGMAAYRAGKKDQARAFLNKALSAGDFPEKREATEIIKQL